MDRTTRFQPIIAQVMETYIRERSGQEPEVNYKIISDPVTQQYQLVLLGWHQRKRIYHVLFHLEIIGDKIWVQEDNTEDSVAEMLVEQGISKKDIVLAYFSPFHRQHTEYAAA